MNLDTVQDELIIQEYVKRFTIQAGEPIGSSRKAADHFRSYFAEASKQELFVVCFLNGAHHVLTTEVLFEGSISTAVVFPREVISRVLELGAGAVMLAHNHPSGSVTPSSSDRAVTKKLKTALEAIDVDLLDHVIVGGQDYFSFSDHRLL